MLTFQAGSMTYMRHLLASGAIAGALIPAAWAASPHTTPIYQFKENLSDGLNPVGNLATDTAGNLYGVTENIQGEPLSGTVFKLEKPLPGKLARSQTILYSFTGGADGGDPVAGLLSTSRGLYGVNSYGGLGYGTIFKLTPPTVSGAPWAETTLHQFLGHRGGIAPAGGLTMSATGGLVGATGYGGLPSHACKDYTCGLVYELREKKNGTATFKVLHYFTNSPDGSDPIGNLVADTTGALYGTTVFGGAAGCGTVYKLIPPPDGQGEWSEQVIYSMTCSTTGEALAGPTLDAAGNLYQTTTNGGESGNGVIFKLTRPTADATEWTYSSVFEFTGGSLGVGPISPVTIDAHGHLYGTTEPAIGPDFGIAYDLAPPVSGNGPYTETVLKAFTRVDYESFGGFFVDSSGNLFGTATVSQSEYICPTCAGAVYEITNSGFATQP
jgi:uncharacterized repeat protein (TIGR03803 family)